MTIDLSRTQTRTFPLFGESGTEIGILTPDHNGYLVAATSSNWQSSESGALRQEIDDAGGSFEQLDETDGEETFVVRY